MTLLKFWCRMAVGYLLALSAVAWLGAAVFDPLVKWWPALIAAAFCAFFSWMLYPEDD